MKIIKNIKIPLLILVSIILLSVSFISGFYLSIYFYLPKYEVEMRVQTMSNQNLIEHLDKNEVSDAHRMLQLSLNGNILALNALIEEGKDQESKDKMMCLLKRISNHRENYTELYSQITVEGYDLEEINIQIDDILYKYKR